MAMISRIFLVIYSVVPLLSSGAFGDIHIDVIQALRAGNAKKLASNFSDHVSLTIKSETGYYSKFQAEMILADFFRANTPTSVKRIQRISTSEVNYYIIYQLNTASQAYRVSIRYLESAGKFDITELRIE